MNIIDAIKDPELFRPFLADRSNRLASWHSWFAALRTVYGLPIRRKGQAVIQTCTGRDYKQLPADGFDVSLFLTGRRSGKSRIAAIIGAYEAALAGHEQKLAKGERGIVAICAPTKPQGRIVRDYIRSIFETPLLHAEVVAETREGFELRNGNSVSILTGDFRSVRGFTLLAAIVDEACFFGLDDEAKVKSDTELVRAIQPSLATVRGKLICISSPYAKKGWCFKQYSQHFGNNNSRTLVWNAPSRTMNSLLSESIVEQAIADDLQAAKSEYLGEFRDDVGEFIPRAVVERLVVPGRLEMLPSNAPYYAAFCDVSGGRADDAALAIAHREERTVVIDLVRRYRPPFNPHLVVGDMANDIKRFKLRYVVGDNYAAEFVARAFQSYGVSYAKAEKPKSQLYVELLPRLCSSEIELLDNPVIVNQLASLERRTRPGGRDIIDHPRGGHDDVANAVAGVADCIMTPRITAGAL